jgi:hypothetical protein
VALQAGSRIEGLSISVFPGKVMSYKPTLINIRERTFLDLLDLSLLVVRRHPGKLAVAAAAGIGPFAALNIWLLADPDLPRFVWPLLLFLEGPWATLPLTLAIGGLMFDQAPGFRLILRRIVVAVPTLIMIQVILRGVLIATAGLLSTLILPRLWFANEVVLLEQAHGLKAIRRCGQLCRNREGSFFAQWLGQIGFGLIFALCFWLGTSAAVSVLIESELTWDRPALSDFSGVRFQVGAWIAIAFFAVARFLIYIDQRIRTEGWELRLRFQAAASELGEARR